MTPTPRNTLRSYMATYLVWITSHIPRRGAKQIIYYGSYSQAWRSREHRQCILPKTLNAEEPASLKDNSSYSICRRQLWAVLPRISEGGSVLSNVSVLLSYKRQLITVLLFSCENPLWDCRADWFWLVWPGERHVIKIKWFFKVVHAYGTFWVQTSVQLLLWKCNGFVFGQESAPESMLGFARICSICVVKVYGFCRANYMQGNDFESRRLHQSRRALHHKQGHLSNLST